MKKIGIIRCQQTEDVCPATTCLEVAAGGKRAFEAYGSCQVIGIVTCGGCSGRRAVERAKILADRGAEIIAFASCIFKGTPTGFVCPHADTIKQIVRNKVGEDIIIVDYTH